MTSSINCQWKRQSSFTPHGTDITESLSKVKANPKYKEMRDMFQNVVDIHTSGHADKATIRKVIEITNPNEVICIHKEADAEL